MVPAETLRKPYGNPTETPTEDEFRHSHPRLDLSMARRERFFICLENDKLVIFLMATHVLYARRMQQGT